ncbi:MAG TPA: toxin TcdB middle/N-terminal domain-containing protein, partial [Polyangiaceae bacterium]
MRRVAISALVLCGLASSARGADKSGVSPDRLRLPKGPGSLEGTGENVQPNLSMGTMSYRVAVDVPEGYPGLTPDLSLVYDSGAGNSPLGIGWSLPLPAIERMTSRGVPRYSPDDVFAAGGSDELVRVSSSGEYRARFEKSFVRYTWQDADGDGTEGYWTAEYPDGRVGYFGADSRGRLVRNARVDGAGGVFRYHLVSMLDALGHELRYGYEKDGGSSRLASVEYVFVDDVPRYEVTLGYEPRADPTSDAKPGVELRTTERLSHIDVMARGSMIRSYELCYDDDCGLVDPDASGVSRLARVRWFGRDGAGPHPIRFSFEYSADLGSSTPSIVEMQGALGVDFRAGTADLVDLDSDGLPDVVDTAGSRHRIFLNELGEGFAEPVTSTTGSLKLGAPGTDMLDLDGDGRTDMVDAEGGFVLWNRGSGDWALEEQPRGFDMPSPGDDANLRFLDYDGDKRIDLVHADRTATWIHENRGSGSFILVEQGLASIGASFVEDALQFADMNGDGLLDAVRKTLGLLAYRMNLGLGRFGDWIEMTNLPSDFAGDEQLVDLNGDALADVVAARGDAVLYAVNRDGTRLADQVVLSRTDELAIPEGSAELSLRFADMNGSGSTDVVWIDPSGAVTYLELFPERPNLLARIDNGIGKTIEIDYGSSVEHLARDGGSGAWQYRLPQALLTVDELTVRDELSGVEQRQVFHYRNGYYDGVERQFRGFTDVVVDTPGDDGVETGRVSHHFDVGADDVYRKGLMLEQRTESAGELLATSEQRYGDCAPSGVPTTTPRVRFLCPVETIRTVTERRPEGEWVTVRENYEYDGYGNRTLLAKLGVTAIGGGACEPCTRAEGAFGAPCGDACSGDESYERTRFVSPGDADGRWILNRPWRKRVSGVDDGDGYSEELTYYDGEPFVGLPAGTLSYGLISRVNLRVSGDERIDGKRFRY